MFIVEVHTPDSDAEYICTTRREALMREQYERRCAETLYGQDDRPNIGVKVVAL